MALTSYCGPGDADCTGPTKQKGTKIRRAIQKVFKKRPGIDHHVSDDDDHETVVKDKPNPIPTDIVVNKTAVAGEDNSGSDSKTPVLKEAGSPENTKKYLKKGSVGYTLKDMGFKVKKY